MPKRTLDNNYRPQWQAKVSAVILAWLAVLWPQHACALNPAKASNSEGFWNEEGATVVFAIAPNFYQTAWFYSICIVLVIVVGTGIYRLRLWKLTTHQKELALLVKAQTSKLQQEISEHKRTENNLQQQLNRISLLNQIIHAVSEQLDIDSIYRVTLQSLETNLKIDFCGVYHYSPETDVLNVISRGLKSRQMAAELGIVEGSQIPGNHTSLRECLNGQFQYLPDVSKLDSVVSQKISRLGIRSVVAAPLIAEGRVFGLMTMARFEVDSFSQEERDFLKALSAQIALAAHHARLHTNLKNAYQNLRQSQQSMMQQERLAVVGQLAAGAAHEFNNIMTIIQGHASLLMSEPGHDLHTVNSLRQISTASDRAANLTRQLLTFSRKGMIQSKALDLNEFIGKVSRLLTQVLGDHITLQCNCCSEQPIILVDEGMIQQVLLNLAVNARDAMPRGGQLRIRTSVVEFDANNMPPYPESRTGSFACIQVTDTGFGIDESILSRIFEPFFTTKEVGKGTGLGLSAAYGIVKQHEGWIDVQSKTGMGTVFKVYLPVTKTLPGAGETPVAPICKVSSGKTILVVEDEPNLLPLVRMVLERFGYAVLEASSGAKAIEVWKTHKDEIALLLTDMVMPDGVSGRDLAGQLLAERPSLKVVYTSGYSPEEIGHGLDLREGVNFLSKPYLPAMLRQIIRRNLDG